MEDEVGFDLLDRTNNQECIDTGSWCGYEDQDQVLETNRNFSMAGLSWTNYIQSTNSITVLLFSWIGSIYTLTRLPWSFKYLIGMVVLRTGGLWLSFAPYSLEITPCSDG